MTPVNPMTQRPKIYGRRRGSLHERARQTPGRQRRQYQYAYECFLLVVDGGKNALNTDP